MADLEGNIEKVQNEEVKANSIISERTLQKIGTNINELIKKSVFDIGDIVISERTEVEFQAEHDSTWVLCDGQNIENSTLSSITGATTAPNLPGYFTKQVNLDADGFNPGQSLNTATPSKNLTHTHFSNSLSFLSPTSTTLRTLGEARDVVGFATITIGYAQPSSSNGNPVIGESSVPNVVASQFVGNEARGKNISYNFFIKID